MDYVILNSHLSGQIEMPTSKSYSHRHVLMALLSKKKTVFKGVNLCDDLLATLNVGKSLGATVDFLGSELVIDSTHLFETQPSLMDVYASGSTLRFMLPICLLNQGKYSFYLRDRLKNRSLTVYEDVFKHCTFTRNDHLLEVEGCLFSGKYEIDASHSSQFASGLLMALPLLKGDSELKLVGNVVSGDYFLMTLDCVRKAGIEVVEIEKHHYFVKGNQHYHYQPYLIEKDASAACFVQVAKYLGHDVHHDCFSSCYQSDANITEYLKIIKEESCVIDVSHCPDIVPSLALAMALSPFEYEIVGASRLKDKESNRLEAVTSVLNNLGANVIMTLDGLKIKGVKELTGGCVSSHQDHRIAMMATIAGLSAKSGVILKDGDCVSKSWPSFYEEIKKVGGIIHELPFWK